MAAPRSAPQLPPELWLKVIQLLRRPAPKANCGASRESAQQGDLPTMMRVSVLFHSLAVPFLYSHVVTDDLLLLLSEHAAPPAHPSLSSKADLVRRITSLWLEYPDPARNATYTEIFAPETQHAGGITHFAELGQRHRLAPEMPKGFREPSYLPFSATVSRTLKAERILISPRYHGRPLFSAMERLCLCRVFGGYNTLWMDSLPATADDQVLMLSIEAMSRLVHPKVARR